MKHELDVAELNTRIALNESRLRAPYYQINEVFSPQDYDWPGDKEGRALLAFVSHYRLTGKKNPCMEPLLEQLPERTAGKMFFPAPVDGVIHEQQLSGHSWLLRGLCEHTLAFGDEFSRDAVTKVVEGLYLPLRGKFALYPTTREAREAGGVSGSSCEANGGWLLSSDTGCAFMSFDGLSAAYEVTGDERILELAEEMADKFASMDKAGMYLQTHCTLSAARGLMRMYRLTNVERYLTDAEKILEIYEKDGITLAYQNKNWFSVDETWTEPCGIVDSMMLAGELYKVTKNEHYRTLAARIYINGLATAQRANGGAGTDRVTVPKQPMLSSQMYEAPFCCSMRLAEGLCYLSDNRGLFCYESGDGIVKDSLGRYFDGDVLLGEMSEENEKRCSVTPIAFDGHRLVPIPKFYRFPQEEMEKIEIRIAFR